MEPILSTLARRGKERFFLPFLTSKTAPILDVGCGSGLWEKHLRAHGFTNVTGLDLTSPATVIGDIRDWRKLGLSKSSFDVVTIFEVLEHVECLSDLTTLLKKGGLLMVTTPVPSRDWILKIFEMLRLTQPRGTEHVNLLDTRSIPGFRTVAYRTVGGLAQWGVYEKL